MGLVDETGNPIVNADSVSPLGNVNALDGTRWDKGAPTGPPDPLVRDVPEWFKPVHEWISNVVHDEAHILDLCLEECVDMVEFNHNKGAVGIDLMGGGGDGAGAAPTRIGYIHIAAMLAPHLYKEVLSALEQRKDVFSALIAEAKKRRDADAGK